MLVADTIRHTLWGASVLLCGTLVFGCSSSHGPAGADGSTGDAAGPDGGECPPVAGSCMDECCEDSRAATFDEDCNASCPAGFRFVDRCAPLPSCGRDGGPCPIDPGYCYGGPCCNDRVLAEVDRVTCTASCPEGYSRRDECTQAPGVRCPPSWLPCEQNRQCELAIDDCCGPCGEPSLEDYDAVNVEYREEHRRSVCPEPTPCPDCAVAPNPALGATCQSGTCRGFDVRTMELSACTSDGDCRLRVTECCECGGTTAPSSLIAIRTDAAGEYQELVCDDAGCDACVPIYPTDEVEAYCADDGHCDVRTVSSTGG